MKRFDMKILIACFLLSTIALTYAKYPITSLPINYKELFEELINKAKHVSAEIESDDDDITELQGIFNVLQQIETEKAKQMQNGDDNSAAIQLWKGLGRVLWTAGKGYLRNKYCTQEVEVRAMIEELVDEQETSEDNEAVEEDSNDTFTELKNLLNSHNQMTTKLMQFHTSGIIDGDAAKVEGWFKKLRKSIKKKAKKLARKVLCWK